MKIKGDINKMIRNKIPKGVLPRTARLNYSAGDIILLVMSATRHQRKRGMGGGWAPAFPDHQQRDGGSSMNWL